MEQQNQIQDAHKSRKSLWIGIGVGFAVGGLTCGAIGYSVSKNRERRIAREHISRARHDSYLEGEENGYNDGYQTAMDEISKGGQTVMKAIYDRGYDKGLDDGLREAEKWIEQNTIQVDSSDPNEIQKAIENQKKKAAEAEERAGLNAGKEKNTNEEKSKNISDDVYAESGTIPPGPKSEAKFEQTLPQPQIHKSILPLHESGKKYSIALPDGTYLKYPIELFCDANGFLGASQTRENLRAYEKDINNLKKVWPALGWGEYYPNDEDGIPSAETINNYDISIEDVSGMIEDADKTLGDEPMEKTIERQRYLDKIEDFRTHPEMAPRHISKRDYDEEAYLSHIRIDYYNVDNVFLEPEDNDRRVDGVEYFGVSNGNELFTNTCADDDDYDPNVTYIRNDKLNFVAEITRYNKSSAGIFDGSAYLNGETSIGGGTIGM